MTWKAFLCAGALAMACAPLPSSAKDVPAEPFIIKNPDQRLSPLTGATRRHWLDAAHYLLDGAFSYVHSLDDPLKFPKQPGKSYPRGDGEVPTEKLEGLCRTLFAAAPLLKEDPSLTLNGIRVGDYYRHQLGLLVDPSSASYIKPRPPEGGPSQNLVEFGALAMAFFAAPEVLWDPLPKKTKDALAAVMLSYGDGPTVPSNWKFFNIFILSFYKNQGYAINDGLLEEYLRKCLSDYRGQGWYNDNPAFDYYSMWAFQLYGRLWAHWFGDAHYPDLARQFKGNFHEMEQTYPFLFGRDGKMILWGRSCSYRFASVGPFPLTGLDPSSGVNFGWMRRIASGVLLQFVTHPEFLKDRVPTLGFYGPFEPAVQVYSCRGSTYWMGKLFLGLLVPEDNPFWTAIENNGPWEAAFRPGTVVNHFLPGSKMLITNYPDTGISEVRAWCHERVADDWQQFRSSENYNRLSYNSAFPWQADSPDGTVAMNYVVKNSSGAWECLRLYSFQNYEEAVYRRTAVLETDAGIGFDLAEAPLAHGILRVDRLRARSGTEVRFGHYALPRRTTPIQTSRRQQGAYLATIIDNGEYQLALVAIQGWDSVQIMQAKGLHPEADESTVINTSATTKNGASSTFVTLAVWKEAGKPFTDGDLFPTHVFTEGSGTSVRVTWASGQETKVQLQ